MKGMESLTLAAVAGLIVFGLWEGRNWLPTLVSGRAASSAPVARLNPTPTEEQHRKANGKGKGAASRSQNPHALDASNEPVFFSELSEPVTVYLPVFPTPNQSSFSSGTPRSQVRDTYGNPSISVSSRQDGHLVERYYYKSDQAHFVVVTLHDGSVVSSNTVDH